MNFFLLLQDSLPDVEAIGTSGAAPSATTESAKAAKQSRSEKKGRKFELKKLER